MDIAGLALDFIAAYGLIAIFVLLVMDGALMLPVFPGELVLVMAVAAYAPDIPSLIFIIILTSAAGLLGSILLYGITRGGGRRLVERFPGFFMMPRKRRERLERSFQRPVGQSLVFFLRLVPLTRVLVNIPAGLARMPFLRFIVLTVFGLVIYHAAFLWFAFEARRPGSAISTQKEQLQEAYANPAMAFVEANAIISGAVLLALGAVISIRASVKMRRDPEESTGSVVGWLATIVLFWGGMALAVLTYMQPESVYFLIDAGGLDIDVIAASLGYPRRQVLFAVAGAAALLGFILHRMNRAATIRRKIHQAEQKAIAKLKVDTAARAVLRRPAEGPVAQREVEFPSRPETEFGRREEVEFRQSVPRPARPDEPGAGEPGDEAAASRQAEAGRPDQAEPEAPSRPGGGEADAEDPADDAPRDGGADETSPDDETK